MATRSPPAPGLLFSSLTAKPFEIGLEYRKGGYIPGECVHAQAFTCISLGFIELVRFDELPIQNDMKQSKEMYSTGGKSNRALIRVMLCIILNSGSLSSEDFLIWACLIEKESSYLQLGGPALMLQQML